MSPHFLFKGRKAPSRRGKEEVIVCPVCIANAATLAVGLTSSGGVAALVITKVRRMTGFRKHSLDSIAVEPKTKEKQS